MAALRVNQVFPYDVSHPPTVVLETVTAEHLIAVLTTVHVIGTVVLHSNPGFRPGQIQAAIDAVQDHVEIQNGRRTPMSNDNYSGQGLSGGPGAFNGGIKGSSNVPHGTGGGRQFVDSSIQKFPAVQGERLATGGFDVASHEGVKI